MGDRGNPSKQWLVAPGTELDVSSMPTDTTHGAPGPKDETNGASDELRERLTTLQEKLWAENEQSLLVVLQAMDAGGKDGTIRKVFEGVNPQGCRVTSFKVPTDEELEHDFLWRVHKATPRRGEIAIFNRSHYEDVLVVRVHDLVPESVWRPRYHAINEFEANLTAASTRIVKFFLHISLEEQVERFQSRLDEPGKQWKFSLGDLDERKRWPDYQAAFSDAIAATSTEHAPWYVIPADRKWYRNFAVLTTLVETLESMDPRYPEPDDDLTGVVIK
ncbi:MAG: polyphosphate kinase 2 family protein [Acidimicrobiales bacterium]